MFPLVFENAVVVFFTPYCKYADTSRIVWIRHVCGTCRCEYMQVRTVRLNAAGAYLRCQWLGRCRARLSSHLAERRWCQPVSLFPRPSPPSSHCLPSREYLQTHRQTTHVVDCWYLSSSVREQQIITIYENSNFRKSKKKCINFSNFYEL